MANNFRLLQEGAAYISKAGRLTGNGAGDFGNPHNPLPSLTYFLQHVADGSTGIVGTGPYDWPSTFVNNQNGANSRILLADGYVRIRGDRHTRYAPFVNAGSTFTGFVFEQFAGFNFRAYLYSNAVYYKQCVFKVLPDFAREGNSSAASGVSFEDCVFENVNFPDFSNNAAITFTRCLFFNCTTATDFGSLSQCYLDATSALRAATATGNNVDPRADPAAGYGLGVAGAPLSRTSPQGLSAAPLFNALAYEDYSVQAGSPHIAAGIGPAQFRQGSAFVVQSPGPGQLATPANTTFTSLSANPVVPVLSTTGNLEGTVQGQLNGHDQAGLLIRPAVGTPGYETLLTGRVLHSSGSPRELSRMQVLGGYNFDTNYPANENELNPNSPQVYNNNVPTLHTNFPNADPDYQASRRNPARLTYGLRWSVKPDPDPTVAADWVLGDTFVECEWNTQPLYNPATLVGNGLREFDPALGRAVVCTWYQLRLGLSNMYFSNMY
jgi:hypothetical protein